MKLRMPHNWSQLARVLVPLMIVTLSVSASAHRLEDASRRKTGGPVAATHPSAPPTSTHGEQLLIRQRKMHTLSPAYDIIDTSKPPMNANSSTKTDVQKNLQALREIVRTKSKLTNGANSTNTKLDEDINTINALIAMLTLANRRLVDQRNKIDYQQSASSPVSTRLPGGKAAKSKPKSETKQRLVKTKESPKSASVGSNTRNSTRRATNADLILVRPGFADAPATKRAAPSLTGAANSPIPMRYPMSPDRMDMMRGHKPIVAHDLLHVGHHQREPDHPLATPMYPYGLEGHIAGRPPMSLLEQLHRREIPTSTLRPMVPPYNGFTLMQQQPLLSGQPQPHSPPQLPAPHQQHHPHQLTNEEEQVHPMLRLLAAARNRQASALEAHERRRAEHEAEMGRQQQQEARRAHEQQLERQRQQAVEPAREEPPGANQVEEENQPAHKQQEEPAEGGAQAEGQTEGNSAEEEKEKDSEGMKEFQNQFDTDFTDLFPPGILSEAEIREMRKQHEEQKKEQHQHQQDDQQEPDEDQSSHSEPKQQQQPSGEEQSGESKQTASKQVEQSKAGETQSAPVNVGQPGPLAIPPDINGPTSRASKTRRSQPDQQVAQAEAATAAESDEHDSYTRPSTTSDPNVDESEPSEVQFDAEIN